VVKLGQATHLDAPLAASDATGAVNGALGADPTISTLPWRRCSAALRTA
jgi:hypothetical protein